MDEEERAAWVETLRRRYRDGTLDLVLFSGDVPLERLLRDLLPARVRRDVH